MTMINSGLKGLKDAQFSWLSVTSDPVSQGSILGTFLLYINDMPDVVYFVL